MDSTVSSRVLLPEFDGVQKNFQIWWTRFLAYAAVMSFTQALKIGGENKMPASEATTINSTKDVGKKQAESVPRNAVALASLTMAFTSEAAIGLVHKVMRYGMAKWTSTFGRAALSSRSIGRKGHDQKS